MLFLGLLVSLPHRVNILFTFIFKNPLTKQQKLGIIMLASYANGRSPKYMEKYSRGRRGAPAKGVGRVYRRESSNLSFSAKKTM